jgi:hypothetical protein
MKRIIYFLVLIIIFQSCSGNSSDEGYLEDYITEDGYEDGAYCADVTYYNPNTGTSSDYSLSVEVVNNEVVQINFDNGGWMNNDHITPQELDENGECTLVNERDYEYTVKITGQGC